MGKNLTDMHCHLGFASNASEVAESLLNEGVNLFANTVVPSDWKQWTYEFKNCPNITVGYGWHPWWITKDSTPEELTCALDRFRPNALGEIGLDFSSSHILSKEQQLAIFQTFAEWAAAQKHCLLSIHAVKATAETLKILHDMSVFSTCTCIYHWFSGSSEDLKRALDAGCYFSVNPRMIASKKGHEYVRQIPVERLLLESDLPSHLQKEIAAQQIIASLSKTSDEISAIKGTDCTEAINRTALRLLRKVRG